MLLRAAARASSLASLASLALLAACTAGAPDQPGATLDAPVLEAPPPASPASPPAADTPSAPPPPAPACEVSVPRTSPIELSVLPEAGAAPFTSVLERATRTIRVMVYLMGTGPILDTLEAKARAGVDVRVILDVGQKGVNQKYMDRLAAAGADVIWSDPQWSYMHAKTLVVDEAEAVVSTGNYDQYHMASERNYAMHDTDPADVDVLVKLFDADFTRTSPDLSCTRLVVSPVNSRDRIVALVASAKTSIDVESMQLADADVRDALAERAAAGVTVRALLADPGWIDANASAAAFLAAHGIEARSMKKPGVHVKAIVVDGAAAYAGSENLSYTSLSKNREVGAIFDEPANVAAMQATFTTDWASATPF
jgi:phosphatidylserine/phosphatidylglycerophosphate/cardiolipin synthase-like enzyme